MVKMTSHVNGSTPLFTVEQVELIRRLRNSGVTKEQLVAAWEALERVDQELGPVYTVPVTIAAAFQQQAQALQRASLTAAFTALTTPTTTLNNVTSANAAVVANAVANATNASAALQQQQQLATTALSSQSTESSTSLPQSPMPDALGQNSDINAVNSRKRSHDAITNGDVDLAGIISASGGESLLSPKDLVNLMNGVTDSGEDVEDTDEYQNFVGQGLRFCADEIKLFVAQNNIKQIQIATLAGISQSYVSRYLKGDFYDMSERSRKAIQRWYILYRKHPEAVVPAVNAVTLMNPGADKKISSMTADIAAGIVSPMNGDLKYPRRERFVFRPNHLEILEKCFQDDNYPSYEKREEIARACNAATGAVTGRELGEKERVTVQIISNWFANKRKELKKLAREEGYDVSQVVRPRGRPSRLYSEIAMMQALERGVNPAATPTQLPATPKTPQSIEGTPEENHKNTPPDGTTEQSSTATIASTPPTPHQSEVANGDITIAAGNNLDEETEESLSWSVEIAAVNQAILSLTGQQPINPLQASIKSESIKAEKQEDESPNVDGILTLPS